MKKKIAVDLGGTNMRVALVEGKKIIRLIKRDTPKSGKKLIKVLEDCIVHLMYPEVIGIGMGVPGPVVNGVLKNPPNIGVKNFDMRKYFQKRFKVPVSLENDANCVALAEAKYGYKKKNFFVITLGTGIGGGVVLDGKLHKGKNGYAGEIGHIILNDKKDFEYYWKLHKRKKLVSDLVKSKDKKDRERIRNLTDVIAQGIASQINVFDPEVVIIAGGARESGKEFIELVRQKSRKYIFLPHNYSIKWTKLKEPGILGASLLVQ